MLILIELEDKMVTREESDKIINFFIDNFGLKYHPRGVDLFWHWLQLEKIAERDCRLCKWDPEQIKIRKDVNGSSPCLMCRDDKFQLYKKME